MKNIYYFFFFKKDIFLNLVWYKAKNTSELLYYESSSRLSS